MTESGRGVCTAEEIGAKVLATLAAQAERNRQAGAALTAAIRAVMVAHSGSARLTARSVRDLLPTSRACSIRRIQEIMQGVRAESSASRL
jgi:hypothetical protein